MTDKQLKLIKEFSLEYYQKTDQFHDARHPVLTTTYALELAKEYPEANLHVLEAACYLHDIGRIRVDEGHPLESAKIAEPFLKEIGISEEETEAILHAVSVHAAEDIYKAKTIEAKLLFDADKIQILSVYGFLRVTFFVIAKRGMDMADAIEFMWDYVQMVWKEYLQTPGAKRMLKPEIQRIEQIVQDFRKGYAGKLRV